MLRIGRKTLALVSVLGSLSLTNISCTDDEKKPENAVTSSSADQPATPSDDSALNPETVYFAFDSSNLDDSTQSKLNKLSDALSKNKAGKLEVAGHTDERGTIEYNLALGQRRANAVKGYIVNLGVEDARVSTISYGKERPVAEGHEEGSWSKNRRAEITLAH